MLLAKDVRGANPAAGKAPNEMCGDGTFCIHGRAPFFG
jgi:hypothetical protein